MTFLQSATKSTPYFWCIIRCDKAAAYKAYLFQEAWESNFQNISAFYELIENISDHTRIDQQVPLYSGAVQTRPQPLEQHFWFPRQSLSVLHFSVHVATWSGSTAGQKPGLMGTSLHLQISQPSGPWAQPNSQYILHTTGAQTEIVEVFYELTEHWIKFFSWAIKNLVENWSILYLRGES